MLLTVSGCEQCTPRTGVQQLQQELSTTCSFQESGVTRLTNNPASSAQPALATHRDGFVLAWVDDRVIPAGLFVQRLDALGTAVGRPVRVGLGDPLTRPRIASGESEILLLYAARRGDREALLLEVLGPDLAPRLETPRVLVDDLQPGRGPGLATRDGRYVAALGAEQGLRLWDISVAWREGGGDGGGGGSDGGGADGGADASPAEHPVVTLRERIVPYGEHVHPPGLLDLTFHGDGLFYAADHVDGWSIQVAEVGADRVRRVAQILDDRRHPESRHGWPAIGPAGNDHLAVMWQGPSMGLTALYLLEIDSEGQPVGRERPFEAIIRDDDNNPVGRAPAFQPALAWSPGGLVVAYADNRFSNTEIFSAAFSCGEGSR